MFEITGQDGVYDHPIPCSVEGCDRDAAYCETVLFRHYCPHHWYPTGSFPWERHRIIVRDRSTERRGNDDE